MKTRIGNVEVRLNEDGTLDEVVLFDDKGACVFHLEQMDDCYWWMGIGDFKDPGYTHVNLCSNNNKTHIKASAERQNQRENP